MEVESVSEAEKLGKMWEPGSLTDERKKYGGLRGRTDFGGKI